MTRRTRHGFGLTEVLLALVILSAFTLPFVDLSVRSSHLTRGSAGRSVMEARARRLLRDALRRPLVGVGTTSSAPAEVGADDGPGPRVLEEEVGIEEVEPGLYEVTARVRWLEAGNRPRERTVTVTRLRTRETLSLEPRDEKGARS